MSNENFEEFARQAPNLKNRGKYYLMHEGKIIAFYDTLEDARATGKTFYRDENFAICFLRDGNDTDEENDAEEKDINEKEGVNPLAAGPSRASIPHIAINLPDLTNWILAAKSPRMRIKPFWTGANGRPFAAMMATQMRIEPPKVIEINGVKTPFIEVNDFYVADEYR